VDQSLTIQVTSFIEHLKFEKRYSAHTLRAYSDDLVQFSDFLVMQFNGVALAEIGPGVVRSWLASLKEASLTSRTIRRKISSLKSFFKFAMRSGGIARNPLATISSPKLARKLPAYVEEKDTDTLFRHVEFGADWTGMTAKLVMQMLYQLGLRLSGQLPDLGGGFFQCTHQGAGKGQ
jgi:integrase/recombinase XerC